MAVVQSTYTQEQRKGLPGMEADMSTYDNDTRICETVAGIGFGLAVAHGAADKGAVLGGALADFSGITIRDTTLDPEDADKYQRYDNMAVKVMGTIWVTTGGAVVEGGPVHYNATTGVLSASGGSGPIVGARWLDTAGSGELARVHLGGGLPAA